MSYLQLKCNMEQEVENMENEIVQLQAQLEGGSDVEETKMSDEEHVTGNYAWCETIVSVAASLNKTSSLHHQSLCHSEQKTNLLQEHSHGALKFESEWPLQQKGDRKISQVHVELTSKPFCSASDVPSTQGDVMHFTSVSERSGTVVCDENAELNVQQGVVSDAVKEVLTRSETEDWSEMSANTLKMLCEPMMLSNDTTDRQNTLTIEHDGERSTNANFDSEKRSAYISVGTDTRRVSSLVEDSACNTSADALAYVCGAELAMSGSCIQLGTAGGPDQDVPDAVDEIPLVGDVAENGVEDDSGSCVSCEDIVIPDSEDDLFSSPHNVDIHRAECVKVSNVCSDVYDQLDQVCDSAQQVNMSDTHSSEMIHHTIVDSLARKKERHPSKEQSSIVNHIPVSYCNETNNLCMSDRDCTDVMKHKFSVREPDLCGTNKTIDTAFELNQQRTTLSVINEQFPKRPHWTFVVSGISQALDQVIAHTTDIF